MSSTPRKKPRRMGVLGAIKQLPNFLKLLYGLITDSRVSTGDKLLLGAAVAYLAAPIDIVPDFIPIVGQLDDLLIVMFALKRLIKRADWDVLLDHWDGDPEDLANLRVEQLFAAGAMFIPGTIGRRLRRLGRL